MSRGLYHKTVYGHLIMSRSKLEFLQLAVTFTLFGETTP